MLHFETMFLEQLAHVNLASISDYTKNAHRFVAYVRRKVPGVKSHGILSVLPQDVMQC
jgi:hypothetical protein